jgi:hypothetical protein
MANRPSLGGFRWVRSKFTSNGSCPRQTFPIADDYATALYRGDPIKLVDGHIEIAASNDAVYGIFDGVKQQWNASLGVLESTGRYTASTSYDTNLSRQTQAFVIPVRGQIFRATCDENTTATTQANIDFASGTATGDQSGYLLDVSTNATTAEDLRVENVPDLETTNFAGTGVELEVSFNLIQDTASGSTTGTTS